MALSEVDRCILDPVLIIHLNRPDKPADLRRHCIIIRIFKNADNTSDDFQRCLLQHDAFHINNLILKGNRHRFRQHGLCDVHFLGSFSFIVIREKLKEPAVKLGQFRLTLCADRTLNGSGPSLTYNVFPKPVVRMSFRSLDELL